MTETIKTNITQVSLGIESTLKTAPGTFYSIEPNSYGDFGPQLSHVARSVISTSRQRLKGTIVDIDIPLSLSFDWTYSTMTRFFQGVMWSATVDKAGTAPITGTQVTVTSVSSTTTYNAASGLTTLGVAGHLVLAEGFTSPATNGLKLVSSGSATTVVTSGLTNETPPAGAKLTLVGHQFAADDISVTLSGTYATIASAGSALVTGLPGVAAGEWIFVGGDATDTFFATCPRFGGRVRTISASTIVLDDVVTLGGVAFVADDGADMTIQIFTGSKIVNGSTMQSIHTEVQLGSGPTATQAMYLSGGVANTLSISSGAQDKLTADMAWVCLGVYERSGEGGDEILSVTRVADPGEQAWSTTTDLKFAKISIADDNSLHDAFFAYDTDATISIDNGVTADKARGVLGGIDVSTDDFMVDVSLNAYFKIVGQMTSIRANEDIQYTEFYAQSNTQKGILFDVARGTLKGNLTLEKGQAVKTPLELLANKNRFGHTLMYQYFAYIPTAFAGAARS
jgi:hypothetical protein